MPFLQRNTVLHELPTGDTSVGSGTQAAWRIQNADLSARHFTITVHEGTAILRPHSSQGILVVNGRQVPHHGTTLAHGDVIAAGAARFVYIADRARPLPPPPPEPGPAFLVNEGEGAAYPLTKRTVSIGRDSASHIIVRDPTVSRFHADVRGEAGQFVLYAMGSAGTRVNGHGVNAPHLLEEGDVIGVGDQHFRFTRQPLAEGIRLAELGAGEDDDRLTRRPTLLRGEPITLTRRLAPPRRPVLPIVIAMAVVVALVVYLVSR
ncbi:MAG: FHA domain-containing protein [Gemmatimonadaceae bacterium]